MRQLQKTPGLAETGVPQGRDEGPRRQMARLILRSVRAALAVYVLFLHYEEGAQREPVRGGGLRWLVVYSVLAVDSRFRNAHAAIRQRPPDEWVRFGRRYLLVSRPRLRRRSTILREEGRLAPRTPSFKIILTT